MKMYAVMKLTEEITVQSFIREQDVKLNWEDGMIGCIPVFSTLTDAEKVAGDKYEIVHIESKDEKA